MKRRNLWIIGIATAVATVAGLNLIMGQSRWAAGRGWGYWRNCYYNDYNDNRIDRIPPNQPRQNSGNY